MRTKGRAVEVHAILGIGVQFGSFATVGAIATGVHYALLVAQVQLLGVPAWLASAAGCLVGAGTSYVLNRRVTFRSNVEHARSLPRFIAVAGAGMTLNTMIVAGMVASHAHYLVAQVVATGAVLIWNFMLNRSWTFRARH